MTSNEINSLAFITPGPDFPLSLFTDSQIENIHGDAYQGPKSYDPIEVDNFGPAMAPGYLNLPQLTQEFLLELFRVDSDAHNSLIQRIGNCGRHASLSERSHCGKEVAANRHLCGSWICENCGRPAMRLYEWAKTRSAEIGQTEQTGIEISAPINVGIKEINAIAIYLTKELQTSSVRHLVIRTPQSRCAQIRMVVPIQSAQLNHSKLSAILRRLTTAADSPSLWHLTIFRDRAPRAVLLWLFGATLPFFALSSATDRAITYLDNKGQLLRLTGDFYSPIPKDSPEPKCFLSPSAEEPSAEESLPCAAGPPLESLHQCSCGCGKLVPIPHLQRITATIPHLEAQYRRIHWGSSKSLPRFLGGASDDSYDPRPGAVSRKIQSEIKRMGLYTDNLQSISGTNRIGWPEHPKIVN